MVIRLRYVARRDIEIIVDAVLVDPRKSASRPTHAWRDAVIFSTEDENRLEFRPRKFKCVAAHFK